EAGSAVVVARALIGAASARAVVFAAAVGEIVGAALGLARARLPEVEDRLAAGLLLSVQAVLRRDPAEAGQRLADDVRPRAGVDAEGLLVEHAVRPARGAVVVHRDAAQRAGDVAAALAVAPARPAGSP